METKFIITVDGDGKLTKPTKEEADAIAALWAASGRKVDVKTEEEYQRETAPMFHRTLRGETYGGIAV